MKLLLSDSHVPKSKSSRVTAEAAEKARVEREGIVLLKLKMADLFAKRDSISANMEASTDNIRGKLHIYVTIDNAHENSGFAWYYITLFSLTRSVCSKCGSGVSTDV